MYRKPIPFAILLVLALGMGDRKGKTTFKNVAEAMDSTECAVKETVKDTSRA